MGTTQATNAVKKGNGKGKRKSGDGITEAEAAMDAAEHLTRDLARVRAKFGMDPVLAPRSLAAAWTTETAMEEDEAEFVDTVADCLGAGLSLEDALTCWDTGGLARDAADETATTDSDDEPAAFSSPLPPARPPSGAHRVVVR